MPTRQEMWDRLDEEFDLLVIGCGITGAGIARDAARRGLSVACVEQKDVAYGTSSRSSKLVHGGLRYLENLEFGLVFEAVSERRILLDIAPHLVNPLGFLFPVYGESRRNLRTISAGMWLYEGLSLFRSPKRHQKMSPSDIAESEPAVRQEDLKGAHLYYDCSTDDARLTLESALDAADHGAIVSTWTKVVSFLKDEGGRVEGVVVRDELTDEMKEVRAYSVVNATGPWTDRTLAMSEERPHKILRPTKGVHIVVDHDRLPVDNAVVCFHPEDERVLFAIPWGDDRTYIGTTDTDYEGDPSDVIADLDDVEYLIEAANFYFPDHQLDFDDVIATWAGLRPLIGAGASDDVDESSVSREHEVIVSPDGLITIAGGKLTTYRKMAAEVVDTAIKLLRLDDRLPTDLRDAKTDVHPLPGAVNWPPDDDHARVADEVQDVAGDHIDADTARYLADSYGMAAIKIARLVYRNPELAEPVVEGRPEIMAQVDWGVEREMAASVTDFFIQRTQLFYRDFDQGLGGIEKVADRMAELLGWEDDERAAHIERYRKDVALSRRWREELSD